MIYMLILHQGCLLFQSSRNLNQRVQFAYLNVQQMKQICFTHVYSFDTIFSNADYIHLLNIVLDSKCIQYFITYKLQYKDQFSIHNNSFIIDSDLKCRLSCLELVQCLEVNMYKGELKRAFIYKHRNFEKEESIDIHPDSVESISNILKQGRKCAKKVPDKLEHQAAHQKLSQLKHSHQSKSKEKEKVLSMLEDYLNSVDDAEAISTANSIHTMLAKRIARKENKQ